MFLSVVKNLQLHYTSHGRYYVVSLIFKVDLGPIRMARNTFLASTNSILQNPIYVMQILHLGRFLWFFELSPNYAKEFFFFFLLSSFQPLLR